MRWLALAVVWVHVAGAAPPLLDPNRTEFPDSSLLDFGERRPDTRRGFLTVDRRGHFIWPGGERARFWGINIATESVFQPTERIDACIERIRRAGFNLVRIHHIDGTGRGILAGGRDSQTFDAAKLRLLDYWIDRLGMAHIAVYLDLLDYRAFLPGDGVPHATALGRGAKPYAVFDERLIALQERYAKALLRDHVNAFNGLSYADDPTIAMIELFDENGLFIRRDDWLHLARPYRDDLTRRWNRFLLDRYGSTAQIAEAWRGSGVARPLAPGETAEKATIPLPELKLAPDAPVADAAERLALAKSSDAARFAAGIHRSYFARMRDYLRREVGVRVPLSAVGDAKIIPDLLAVARELDFVGTNFYWDHPVFRSGRAWQKPFLFQYHNPLASNGAEAFGPKVALARMSRKPVVVREWNHCFPNPYRAAGMVEATAYAALQDVDAMILFTYGAVPEHRKVGFFDVHQDPARWGLAAILGELFRTGAVAPARRSIEIGFSDVDTFLFKDYRSDVRSLAWVSRVATRCFGTELTADADLTIASGRSAAARYRGQRLLLSRADPSTSTAGHPAPATDQFLGYPTPLIQGAAGSYWFDGSILFGLGTWSRPAGGRFRLRDLDRAGLAPIGQGASDAIGFRDDRRDLYAFGPLSGREQQRAALDLLRLIHGERVGRADEERRRHVSDTGELVRDQARGRLTIVARRAVGVAGELGDGPHQLGTIRIETATARGAAVIVSLDDQPIARTSSFVARFVANAVNSRMAVEPPGPRSNPRGCYSLTDEGVGPVRTSGRPVSRGWRVYRGGTLWFAVGIADGVVEVVRVGDRWRWFTDTPGVYVWGAGPKSAVAIDVDGAKTPLSGGGPWRFPAGAAMLVAE